MATGNNSNLSNLHVSKQGVRDAESELPAVEAVFGWNQHVRVVRKDAGWMDAGEHFVL